MNKYILYANIWIIVMCSAHVYVWNAIKIIMYCSWYAECISIRIVYILIPNCQLTWQKKVGEKNKTNLLWSSDVKQNKLKWIETVHSTVDFLLICLHKSMRTHIRVAQKIYLLEILAFINIKKTILDKSEINIGICCNFEGASISIVQIL